ncbi:ubiquitin-conjugating enzyme family protein [Striga asiatica]|uniref:Ubiquitin-conjugating enzyme family protein n=1 Tax=Striga asiatica TaxID=4170 RepID=A0A5A7RGB1_STRAF|nr:ubiquitin-conjugating enzyme family protein [Striga asiatica]
MNEHSTREEIQEMLNEADTDGDGTVDFDEFLSVMTRKTKENVADEVKGAIRVFNWDQDGFILGIEVNAPNPEACKRAPNGRNHCARAPLVLQKGKGRKIMKFLVLSKCYARLLRTIKSMPGFRSENAASVREDAFILSAKAELQEVRDGDGEQVIGVEGLIFSDGFRNFTQGSFDLAASASGNIVFELVGKRSLPFRLLEPVSNVVARPLPNDILDWHYVLEGSQGTAFAGGYYYGKIKFPPEYPFKPPGISWTIVPPQAASQLLMKKNGCLQRLLWLLIVKTSRRATCKSGRKQSAQDKNSTLTRRGPTEEPVNDQLPKELNNNQPQQLRRSIPTWLLLLLVSIFSAMMALPSLHL